MRRRALLASLALPALARAQAGFPDRPIRMVVPLPAGGATDIWARIVAEPMATYLGQPVVIENRAGAGGMIGTESVKNAVPDGHTILFHITNFVQTPVVLKRWPYQVEDFFPVGKMGTTPLPFCCRADLPVTTLAEFIAYAKGRNLSYGTYSPGSSGHAFGELLSRSQNLGMTAVHYRGEAPMLQDVLGGRIDCGFHSMAGSGEHIRAGRVRPLAAIGISPIPSMPQVPSFASLGFPREDWANGGFVGVWAPVRTPDAVKERLVAAMRHAMTSEATLRRMAEIDTIPLYLGPQEFAEDIAQYLRFWSGLVERMGLTVEG